MQSVCMHVRKKASVFKCFEAGAYTHPYVCMYIRMYVCMYIIYITYINIHYMYIYTYICMCARKKVFIHPPTPT
jgi:hypothetical protein